MLGAIRADRSSGVARLTVKSCRRRRRRRRRRPLFVAVLYRPITSVFYVPRQNNPITKLPRRKALSIASPPSTKNGRDLNPLRARDHSSFNKELVSVNGDSRHSPCQSNLLGVSTSLTNVSIINLFCIIYCISKIYFVFVFSLRYYDFYFTQKIARSKQSMSYFCK